MSAAKPSSVLPIWSPPIATGLDSSITPSSLINTLAPIFEQEADTHLAYAISTALNSSALKPHWQDSRHAPTITKALADFKKLNRTGNLKQKTLTKLLLTHKKGLQTIDISCIPERLLFTKDKFNVEAGKPVRPSLL
jgi:hypothetical protein